MVKLLCCSGDRRGSNRGRRFASLGGPKCKEAANRGGVTPAAAIPSMPAIPLNPNTTGSEFAAVVAMMPIADQRSIEAKVREILEDRRLSSAGAVIGIPIAAGEPGKRKR
jgi:hypothetical protein